MSLFPNVSKQDIIEVAKLSKQQKNGRAIQTKNKTLKQTHKKQLAEILKPMITKLTEV